MRVARDTWFAVAAITTVAFGFVACSHNDKRTASDGSSVAAIEDAGERATGMADAEVKSERPGEHDGELGERDEHANSEGAGEHGDREDGEESGIYIGVGDTWDSTRNGARLVLSFHATDSAFRGIVENSTEHTLCGVRVEVHLSTGTELGPTERADVPPGGEIAVELSSTGEPFDTWTAHPETSACGTG